jgi:hypothetical protein
MVVTPSSTFETLPIDKSPSIPGKGGLPLPKYEKTFDTLPSVPGVPDIPCCPI